MITIDGPISFLAGGGLALACREGKKIIDRDRLFYRGMTFQATILTPVILFFMVRFPDWEWNYLFDARAFFFDNTASPWGFVILAAATAAISGSFYLGFRASEYFIAQGRPKTALNMLGAVGALVAVIMAILHDQALHLGTLAEYRAGTATLLFLHVEFMVVQGVAGVLIAGAIAWIVRSTRRGAQVA